MSPVATATRSGNRASRARPANPKPAAEAPDRPLGRVLSSTQFWALMQRWGVPDAQALELIQYPGKPGKSGKRPRFRFTTHQQRLTAYLPEIDAALAAAGKEPGWLHRRSKAAPFAGASPLAHMMAGGAEGMAEVLHVLTRMAMRVALTQM